MTYLTPPISSALTLGSRITTMVLVALVLIIMQSSPAQAQWTTTGNNISNSNTGNVGIGTSNPQYGKLQVNKVVRIDDDSGSANGSDTLLGGPSLYLGTTLGGGNFQFNGNGGIDLWQYNAGWGRTVTFTKNGNVGIGTTSPSGKLEVSGSSGAPNFATAVFTIC